ncbi:hypothetical protein [Cryobacterium psychrophilum]|uniref:hypothetical protein n=1 Tax=Cryobacterium psychrophilum TaxID=41988 RepID=UPI001416FE92|nr:hypothetical protein [Cryobacterium psychrophilum]
MRFLDNRSMRTLERERFVPSISTTLDRLYEATTEKYLLLIRAQNKTQQIESAK